MAFTMFFPDHSSLHVEVTRLVSSGLTFAYVLMRAWQSSINPSRNVSMLTSLKKMKWKFWRQVSMSSSLEASIQASTISNIPRR